MKNPIRFSNTENVSVVFHVFALALTGVFSLGSIMEMVGQLV
jgi:hypothetical protein